MARSAYYTAALCILSTGALGIAQEFKRFPGSQLDEKGTREASQSVPGKESQVYSTSENYDKVYAFYKALYKQDTTMPPGGPKLPNGQQVQWAFFILDNGSSLAKSKFWMKIQYPYVGGTDGKDIRNVTV